MRRDVPGMGKSCSGVAGGIADGRLTQGDDPVLMTIEVVLEALD